MVLGQSRASSNPQQQLGQVGLLGPHVGQGWAHGGTGEPTGHRTGHSAALEAKEGEQV